MACGGLDFSRRHYVPRRQAIACSFPSRTRHNLRTGSTGETARGKRGPARAPPGRQGIEHHPTPSHPSVRAASHVPELTTGTTQLHRDPLWT